MVMISLSIGIFDFRPLCDHLIKDSIITGGKLYNKKASGVLSGCFIVRTDLVIKGSSLKAYINDNYL